MGSEMCIRDRKEKRAELLHKLLPGMAEDVVILPHFYTDYGYNCVIGAGSYLNHGAYLMDCAKITIGQHCFIGPGCGMDTCLLYTSDAADEEDSGKLGGRRITKKRPNKTRITN